MIYFWIGVARIKEGQDVFRQYSALKPTPQLRSIYRDAHQSRKSSVLEERLFALLDDLGAPLRLKQKGAFAITAMPSLDWTATLIGDVPASPPLEDVLPELIVVQEFDDPAKLRDFREFLVDNLRKPGLHGDAFLWIGADPGGHLADHWCPGGPGQAAFGTRSDARRSIKIDVVDAAMPPSGQGAAPKVNVVIIDQGLSKKAILATHPCSWGGGWAQSGNHPGCAEPTSHGMMIARNVLDIAPDAVVYDVPLIPAPVISKVPVFASTANAAYRMLLVQIELLRKFPRWSGPWIFVNAWAIYDRATEEPLGDYTEDKNSTDPHSIGHRLNAAIAEAASTANIDVIFAAGNCGTFCPAARCGKVDRGPGRSIWGGNSSSATITASGVLTNDMWLGYSSQGPGQQRLGVEKPDLCAPSVFAETRDPHTLNTGTSAACALTAGVVATLRRGWDATRVPPAALKQTLIESARRIQGSAWNNRTGHGVLDAAAAYGKLSIDYPRSLGNRAEAQPAETFASAPAQLKDLGTGGTQTVSWLRRVLTRIANLMR